VSFIRSNPRVLHLIHAYREHPCLWDPSDKNYEDELARNIAYEAIMVRMDNRANVLFTLEELKKTIEQLHIQYALALETTLCDRSFAGRAELTTHVQRVHIGKTRKCTHCEMAFSVISDLRLHIRTHTGHKPYICEHCGKAFRLRSQMTLHVTAIHKKLRAFKCTMCPKDFVKKVHLTDHIKGHLNIRDKICGVCGKGFTSGHSLIRHRQIHSEVKKFVCKVCDARFSQFVGLNSHMKRTHNIVRNNNNSQKAKEEVESDH